MEFTIKQSVLKDELGYVNGIVEKKSTIPVLSNILIESVGEGVIRIVGTDLDVTIRCEAPADVRRLGRIVVRRYRRGTARFRRLDRANAARYRVEGGLRIAAESNAGTTVRVDPDGALETRL